MNLCLSMAFRPSSFMIMLAYVALIVLASLMPCWYVMVTHIEKRVNLNTANVIVSQLQSEIEYSAELLNPMKSSSTNLARLLSSSLDSTNISFSDIHTKVAPLLFQAFETVPHLTQISYMGMNGLFFSYNTNDDNEVLAMYSNSSSFSGGALSKTLYYIQPVNRENGKVYGEATICNNSINASWIHEAFNLSNGIASLGTKWSNGHDLLFLNSVRVARIGVISLGFSAKAIIDYVTRIDRQGTTSYLVTKDGKVIVQGIQHTRLVISNDTVSFQSVNANGDLLRNEGTVSCKDEIASSSLNIQDTPYLIHCYPIDIMGIESVYVLAIPQNGFISFDLHYKEKGLILLILMMVMIFLAIFSFVFMNVKATRREMHLCASLIKQMEATQQAERKNMNKSLAFASASHDVRAYLAGLVGLIDLSYKLVVSASELDINLKPRSELETNFKQMNGCTQDLLGLLNSILDTSKMEAGKMQLEEEEFDVSNLLEDVVDLYHPMAMKKGVDIVLDPCNGSVIRYSRVKGDRGKLKQVLCNLLSNAVKFTDEGHITVRARAQEAKLQNSIIKTKQCGLVKRLSCLFHKKNESHVEDLEKAMSSIQHDPNSMDFVFEVDDTGKGIRKENYKSVFENYVQVKDTSLGQVGTGLGLGIVQSLVRLMHGDIGIVNKEEKGTCFRFNVLLTLCESETVTYDFTIREGLEYESSERNQAHEPSSVVLYMADEERRRTLQMFMERLGIQVEVVKHWKHLFDTLKKIKQKGTPHLSEQSSPESSDLSTSYSSHGRTARVPFRAMDGTEYVFKKTNTGAAPSFTLIVIDANAGPFSKLCRVVSNFKKDLLNPCKVVWLDKPLVCSIDFKSLDQEDIVISKPFHGTRMFDVIKLLPEYGGNWQRNSSKGKRESSSTHESPCLSVEHCWKGKQKSNNVRSKARKCCVHQGEIQECGDSSDYNKPLSGKRFLVVEDSALSRKIALANLRELGATFDQCENGEQAVRLVGEVLTKDFPNPPYDYILMDCQMPVMDGFEATRRIREMEKCHGLRIPIIALTADIEKKTTETGMDFQIVKPITTKNILEAIRCI